MGFARTKDRVFAGYETMSGWLARRSAPVRGTVYRGLGSVLWVAYALPGSRVRATMQGFARHVGAPSARRLFGAYVRHFIRGTELTERVRHGYGAELDGTLEIPEKDRMDALLAERGLFLALPHLHASLAMSYCLAQSYPVLAVVSLTRNEKRAQAQRDLYSRVNADFLDVRSEEPGAVARRILQALKSGKIVIGTVDRIQGAPEEQIDKARDVVRVSAFGAPVGFGGWPTRFATKAKAPVIPAMVEQTDVGLRLILGEAITPTGDIAATTQALVSELEQLVRTHPHEWAFALDKHWARVLTAPQAPPG